MKQREKQKRALKWSFKVLFPSNQSKDDLDLAADRFIDLCELIKKAEIEIKENEKNKSLKEPEQPLVRMKRKNKTKTRHYTPQRLDS